jgi:hypothetical protein
VLALGGQINPDADICYDTALPPSAWEQIKTWQQPHVANLNPIRPTKPAIRKLRPPEDLPAFRELMARKARLKPFYVRLRVPAEWSGSVPERLNALMFAHLLQQRPELTDNLLSVRESLFTPRRVAVTGETVFALKAWEPAALGLKPLDGYVPEMFRQAKVELRQPGIGARVQEWLRAERIPFSARRDGNGYRLELSAEARKKRIVFDAYVETDFARLTIGPKCRLDLGQIHVTALDL